ncbi:uncharacterized protein AKAME5_001127400 [Lates japonicus]|uniref:Uncharacterized protein n=1 Tax=Lates japonicus TaxID=270547 RepID=A0AAD3MSN5_LATJO|nr:uncharacterized protein AKAME5_001127400 [Lates japonicus]
MIMCLSRERRRVSQLLSKFGSTPSTPSRSKSSDNFLGREEKILRNEDDQQSEERKADRGIAVEEKACEAAVQLL